MRARSPYNETESPKPSRGEDAYARAYPFERPAPEPSETAGARAMIGGAATLAYRAIEAGAVLNVIANDRAFGNAPSLARAVAFRFLEVAARRGA